MVLAFAAVYLVWGSTYLAIRFAIETLPPFTMAGVRFLTAGAILYAWSRWRGSPNPSLPQWKNGLVVGSLLLLGGNGGVVWAEQFIPSGLAALLVATVPVFMVIVDWWTGSKAVPSRPVIVGLVGGFGGVAILVDSPGLDPTNPEQLAGGIALLAASALWAVGSIRARHVELPPRQRMSTAVQMLTGGGALVAVGFVLGEVGRVDLAAVSLLSFGALLYLIVFGSLIGFSCYAWILQVSSPARVSTYAYVNPLVALILGWALADEPLSARTGVAAAVILGSVALITSRRRRSPVGPDPVDSPAEGRTTAP
ncbi:MAG: EamA family transporter [Longimicrobiales bacterium]|nr:EamA family transporter [Longimicrobiales bacterium]